ncbi:uncharacterized protein LOC122498359 [Leptopilina heterotoma]|uniref:uncharacterized protein LOC122498359 n=1 Tax=Leptopilina heterotoma TaxID=63436 RepID=UPI001CA8F9C9|nr:uncharacterized protein LOC122498359 [Leptopilina heterotoma]XP_043461986.1 uncharacterized protein LOC122498359 [Leptopilina heterotoma]
MNKNIFIFTFATTLIFIIVSTISGHPTMLNEDSGKNISLDFIFGSRINGDTFIMESVVKQKAKPSKVPIFHDFVLLSKLMKITQLIVEDQWKNGTGAEVSIEYGSLGTNNVTLKFVGQEGYGFDYIVKVFMII